MQHIKSEMQYFIISRYLASIFVIFKVSQFCMTESEQKQVGHTYLLNSTFVGQRKQSRRCLMRRFQELYKNQCSLIEEQSEFDEVLAELSGFDYSHLPNGTTTQLVYCTDRRTLLPTGVMTMCRSCFIKSTFPRWYFPRELHEIYCGTSEVYCLSGNGSCEQSDNWISFKWDRNHVGKTKMDEWPSYKQKINTGCECKVIDGTPMSIYV